MINSKLQKQIQGQIADASGHTDFMGTIDEAVEVIFENAKNGKWAYINGAPFNFTAYSNAEKEQVYNLLNEVEEPHFVLTGKLQGGNISFPLFI